MTTSAAKRSDGRAGFPGVLAVATTAALWLVGCGGVVAEVADSLPMPSAAAAAASFAAESEHGPGDRPEPEVVQRVPTAPASAGATLAGDAAAVPIDHAARTRLGLYLRRADAERIERELRGDVVWVDAGCCAGEGADLAVLIAYGQQAAKNLGDDAPFFVTGGDQRLAAQLVNRLSDAGIRRPYLIAP